MRYLTGLAVFALLASASQLPEGAGRQELERVCKQCHELARAISLRQDRDGWSQTLAKMSAYGMKCSAKESALVIDYLAKNYPAEELPKINVNTASAIELESGLSLRRSQSKEVLAYRARNGKFKSLDDLKKVPLIDADQIDSHKDRITF